MSENLVIIPTYNESENIARLIPTIMGLEPRFDVLVVDDHSPDGTAQIVRELQRQYPERLHLIERKGKLGLGTAYIEGFRFGLARPYHFIYEMDADFSHDPADLPRLMHHARNDSDLVIGSRYIRGGGVENWPTNRLLLSRGASIYVRLITGMPIKDPTAGFVCFRRKVLETIDLEKIQFIGYAFQIEMKYAAYSLGFRLKEIPIIFRDRIEGSSKMSKKIIREAITGVLKIKLNSFKRNYYRKPSLTASQPKAPQP